MNLPLAILLADENPLDLFIVKSALQQGTGWLVFGVANGIEAVQAVRSGKFDVALINLDMPEMDVFTAAETIRRGEARGERLPIIALTANPEVTSREKCVAAGMDEYPAKPFRCEELMEKIKSAVAKRQPMSI